MDKLIEKNYHLNKAAFEAYKSYLHVLFNANIYYIYINHS